MNEFITSDDGETQYSKKEVDHFRKEGGDLLGTGGSQIEYKAEPALRMMGVNASISLTTDAIRKLPIDLKPQNKLMNEAAAVYELIMERWSDVVGESDEMIYAEKRMNLIDYVSSVLKTEMVSELKKNGEETVFDTIYIYLLKLKRSTLEKQFDKILDENVKETRENLFEIFSTEMEELLDGAPIQKDVEYHVTTDLTSCYSPFVKGSPIFKIHVN